MEEIVDRLFARALKYISYRDRSEKEVVDYLNKKLRKSDDLELVDKVVEKLKGHNLIDDLEFAGKWVGARFRSGRGPVRIGMELVKKGIERSVIKSSLMEIDDSGWIKSAKELIGKRKKRWEKEEYLKKREKAMRFLVYRRFPLGMARKVIDQTLKRE